MKLGAGSSRLEFALLLGIGLVIAGTSDAQPFLQESSEAIVQAILPHAGQAAPAAGTSGCGQGQATFFSNREVCSSKGDRSPQPMGIDSDCAFIALEAETISRPLRFDPVRQVLDPDHARYLRERMAVALNHDLLRPCLKFVIEAPLDGAGPSGDRRRDAEERARQVVDILAAHGVDRERLRSAVHHHASQTDRVSPPMTFRPEPIK